MSVRTLIVYVAGLNEDRTRCEPLLAKLRSGLGAESAETWMYPKTIRLFTRGPMAEHAADLAARVDARWDLAGQPERIILIGHSIGGVLVRYAYLLAKGVLGGRQQPWAGHVWRMVLLAAPNRGFDLTRLGTTQRWLARIAASIAGLARPANRVTSTDMLKGSAFITDLRLEWMRSMDAAGDDSPLVVQVLGDADDMVTQEDSLDIEGMPRGTHIGMPGADHATIMLVDDRPGYETGQQWSTLRRAILDETLEPEPAHALSAREKEYTSVVFLLHGIRAGNDEWVQELEATLDPLRTIKTVTASYGRFSAFDFAVPLTRRRNRRWFHDQYTFQLAKHPTLPFHFVGHSNGTYMFGESLRRLRAMRFDRVLLAGSVLPRDFDWPTYVDAGRIGALVNICANRDVPVGLLCSLLRGFGMRDVGLGGFVGFDRLPDSAQQLRYVNGGHGEAFTTTGKLQSIADFISAQKTPTMELATKSKLFAFLSRCLAALPVSLFTALLTMLVVMYTSGVLFGVLLGVLAVAWLVIVLKVI